MKQFLTDNGMRYVSIVENSTAVSKLQQKLVHTLAKSGVAYAKTSAMEDYVNKYVLRYLDAHIFIFDIQRDDLSQLLHAVTRAPVRTVVVFCKSKWMGAEETVVQNKLQTFAHDSMFHLAVPSKSGITW